LKDLMIKSVGMVLAINFSWFAIGALVDLSTIATYSLGAMPLSILKETNNKDMPILEVASYLDYQSKEDATTAWIQKKIAAHTYYKRGNINIPECDYHKSIIIWPKYFPDIPGKPEIKFNNFGDGKQYCAVTTQTLADISNLEKWKTANFQSGWVQAIYNKDRNNFMINTINKIITTWDCITTEIDWWVDLVGQSKPTPMSVSLSPTIVKELQNTLTISDGQVGSIKMCSNLSITGNAYQNNNRQTAFMQWPGWQEPYTSQNGLTMNTLINKSKGMVWPFITLYMSLLDFSNLSIQDTDNKTTNSTLWWITEFTLKAAISIALIIPLIALAVILIIRIVILRGVIAFIPLGIVVAFLWKEIGMWDTGQKEIWGMTFNKESIIWLIFAPVLPVFAISISIIILQTLQIAMKDAISTDNKTWDFFGIEFSTDNKNTTSMDFWWMQTIELDKWSSLDGWSGFANFLPRLFLNIFAIWLMWTMVKMSLSGSKITGAIGWKIMDTGKNLLWSIPIPGTWWLWMSSISRMPKMTENALERRFNREITDDNEWYDKRLSSVLWNEKPEKNKENSTENNWTVTTNTEIKNQAEVSKTFRSKLPTLDTPSFDIYKQTIAEWIKTQWWTQWAEESKKFLNAGSASQAWVMANFLKDLEDEKQKIDKTEIAKITAIQQQIDNLSKHTVTGWYQDFLDTADRKKITNTKINEFVQYLNNPDISKLLTDQWTKPNPLREQIKTDFWTQIEYKDGKFQVTAK